MENPTARINELMAELEDIKRAHFTVRKTLTDPERRERGAVLTEYRIEWEADTDRGRKELAAIIEERKSIEASIKASQAILAKIGHRAMEVQHAIAAASERYRELRDPILRELQAGTSDLTAEFLKVVDAHIAAAYRILPPDAVDLTAPIRSDLASRDRRVAGLRALREDCERNLYKRTEESEGELRSWFARALAAIPAAANKSGGVFKDEFWEFARTGGGRWPAAN